MIATLNQVLFGDVRQTLRGLPERLFHCAVTSPPYWNLRSYLKADDLLIKGTSLDADKVEREAFVYNDAKNDEIRKIACEDAMAERAARKAAKK